MTDKKERIVATMNVSLPDAMKAWVDVMASTGRYSNASDYVRDLIRRDQQQSAKLMRMQELVTEALEGGVGTRSMKTLAADAKAGLQSD